jgi:hypothetical protein
MYTVMMGENNLQADLFGLDCKAVQRLGPNGLSGFSAIE